MTFHNSLLKTRLTESTDEGKVKGANVAPWTICTSLLGIVTISALFVPFSPLSSSYQGIALFRGDERLVEIDGDWEIVQTQDLAFR